MASDIFLKIDGIQGEATDVNHQNEIEVWSWSWGVSEVFITSRGGAIVRSFLLCEGRYSNIATGRVRLWGTARTVTVIPLPGGSLALSAS